MSSEGPSWMNTGTLGHFGARACTEELLGVILPYERQHFTAQLLLPSPLGRDPEPVRVWAAGCSQAAVQVAVLTCCSAFAHFKH